MYSFLLGNILISFISRHRFWFILALAIVITRLPIISIPFNWLESYFHEISHGLAALISSGKIVSIQLFLNGAGLCTTQGGSRFLISFMGYFGATLWGFTIYSLAQESKNRTKAVTVFILLLLSISVLLWVRDLLTFFIVVLLFFIFYLKWRYQKPALGWILQLTAMVVLLNSILSPLHLLDGRHLGDGAALANLTFLPEIVWVILWSAFGLFALYLLSKKGKRL